ncbi:Protease HtpX [Maioricimonas rarisocia]|uniref:Protease HtpX n=1 Tax=Maioricimonas rarisocia TaxID=2528026 RepID=A0A517ZCT8_9PLAN|nr:tetratricopeptide repeat protein [Maioricimonas rarisocia]QDU40304.1 Protease HtpX [Maioricimonas rarisocia]
MLVLPRLLMLAVVAIGLCSDRLNAQETASDDSAAIPVFDAEEIARDLEPSIADLSLEIEKARTAGDQEAVGSLLTERGTLHLANDDVESALSDFAASLEAMPDNLPARTGLVECYERLGMHQLADAELERILRDMEGAPYEPDAVLGESLLTVLDDVAEVVAIGIILGGLFLMLLPLNMLLAWRQSKEGGGTWLRLIAVSGTYALYMLAPVVAWLCCRERTEAVAVFLPAFVFNFTLAVMALGRPVRVTHVKGAMPLVTDQAFLLRVSELSRQLGLRTPRVRMLRTLSSTQPAMAWVGGMPAPSLVVTDGILHRLEADERDFVIAHELAHVANGSLWWLTGVTPVAAVGAVLATMYVSPMTALLIGWCVRVGLYRVVSRYFEFDCDRRAAKVIGYETAVSALKKIHAAHPLRERGVRSFIIYATATHPPQVARLDSLWRRAPDDVKPERDWSVRHLRRGRFGAVGAACLWLAAIAGALSMGTRAGIGIVDGLLLLVGTVPLWPMFAMRSSVRRQQKKVNYTGSRRNRWMVAGLVVVLILLLVAVQLMSMGWLDDGMAMVPVLGMVVAVILILHLTQNRSAKVEQELVRLLQDHEFEKAIELARQHPQQVARSPVCRYNVAVATGLAGDRETAITELRQLRADEPKMLIATLTLAVFLLDEGQLEEVLGLAESLETSLPDDPEPQLVAGRALSQLGRLDEAEASAREALSRDEDEGVAWTLLAEVAVGRGDRAEAETALSEANRLAPGLPYNQLVRAEMLMAGDDAEAARSAVRAARQAVKANPFAILERRMDRLAAEFTGKWSGGIEPYSEDVADPTVVMKDGEAAG